MSDMSEDKERPRGMAGIIWTLEHAQDVVSVIVGVMLIALAVVVLVLGVVDFFRDIDHESVENADPAVAPAPGARENDSAPVGIDRGAARQLYGYRGG